MFPDPLGGKANKKLLESKNFFRKKVFIAPLLLWRSDLRFLIYGTEACFLTPLGWDGNQKVAGINKQFLFALPPFGVSKQVSAPLNKNRDHFFIVTWALQTLLAE